MEENETLKEGEPLSEAQILGRHLNQRREVMSKAEGRPYDEPIPWSELAERGGIHYTNLVRWEKGQGMPSHFEDKAALAAVFGEDILELPGMQIDSDMAWVWENRHHPAVKAEIKSMRRNLEAQVKVKNSLGGGEIRIQV